MAMDDGQEVPILPSDPDDASPRTVVINCQTIAAKLLKPFVSLALIIGFSAALANPTPGTWSWSPWFLLGIFGGIYLLLSAVLQTPIEHLGGKVEWTSSRNTKYVIELPAAILWFTVDCIFSTIMLICFCVVSPWHWTFGHVVGITVSILIFLKAGFLLTINLKDGKGKEMTAGQMRVSSARAFKEIRDIFSAQENPDCLSRAGKQVAEAWIGFSDADTAVATLKGRRVGYFILLLLALALCVVSCVAEVCLIKDWDTYNHHPNHERFSIPWGPFGRVDISMRYWAGISTGSCIPLLVLLMAGSLKPSRSFNLIISILSLTAGAYFAVLSFYTTASLLLLQEKTVHGTDLIFRFMHLLPIPAVSVLLISFGIATFLVPFNLQVSTTCHQWFKVLGCIPVLLLSSVLLVYSQYYSLHQLSSRWSPEQRLDWRDENMFVLFIVSEVLLAFSLLILSLTTLLSGKRRIPGVVSSIMYLSVLSFAVFATFTLYGLDDKDSEIMVWGPVKYVYTGMLVFSLGLGLVGFCMSCVSLLRLLVAGFFLLILILGSITIFFFSVGNTVKVLVDQNQESGSGAERGIGGKKEEQEGLIEEDGEKEKRDRVHEEEEK